MGPLERRRVEGVCLEALVEELLDLVPIVAELAVAIGVAGGEADDQAGEEYFEHRYRW